MIVQSCGDQPGDYSDSSRSRRTNSRAPGSLEWSEAGSGTSRTAYAQADGVSGARRAESHQRGRRMFEACAVACSPWRWSTPAKSEWTHDVGGCAEGAAIGHHRCRSTSFAVTYCYRISFSCFTEHCLTPKKQPLLYSLFIWHESLWQTLELHSTNVCRTYIFFCPLAKDQNAQLKLTARKNMPAFS